MATSSLEEKILLYHHLVILEIILKSDDKMKEIDNNISAASNKAWIILEERVGKEKISPRLIARGIDILKNYTDKKGIDFFSWAKKSKFDAKDRMELASVVRDCRRDFLLNNPEVMISRLIFSPLLLTSEN